jgi:hypothetical protein
MPKLTQAQKQAQNAVEKAAQEAALSVLYPEQLMAILERASKLGFEIKVRDNTFVVTDNDFFKYFVTLAYTAKSQQELYHLQYEVEDAEEAEAERIRRGQLRQAALAKLSKEELEVLGL